MHRAHCVTFEALMDAAWLQSGFGGSTLRARELSMVGDGEVSVDVAFLLVERIVVHWAVLELHRIGGCRLVTQRAISALQSDCPDLAVVYFLGDSAPKAMPRAAPPPAAATRVR